MLGRVGRRPHYRLSGGRLSCVILYVRTSRSYRTLPRASADSLPVALGIAQLVETGKPDSSYFLGLAKNLGIGYTSTIIGVEILVTGLITGRILWLGKRYRHAMGDEVGRAYTSAAAIIVESMLLSSLTGIAYIVTFALGNQLEIFFLSIYVMMTVSGF